ncbi:MAG TPA: GNAT family N-acetyltransferase [Solirubrobacter sp.]|nr:GNAT family N-acetyltransferase [Solirubrobacter sp.]
MTRWDGGVRRTLDLYYDAAPRSAARVEEAGPFTLVAGTGPWPYYARPRLGTTHEFTAGDIEAARARQRELGLPETFEWVHETTPSLLAAARGAGLDVLEAPLMVLDRAAWREPEVRAVLRILAPDDEALAAARAVQHVGFAAPGTASGPQGRAERDAAVGDEGLEFLRERIRRRATVMAVAETGLGPVAAGQHQPVAAVTEIVGVATLPALRRQGLGGAVTGALVEDALEHGAETVFLSAGSDDIARVYHRLGFRRVGTACIVG